MVALSVLVAAHAQGTPQSTYSMSLNYFTVQLAYPSQVNPGDSVTVNMQAVAKNSLSTASLTAQVFYADGNSLHQLASATVASNGYLNSGASLSKQITFTVPQDTPRTSLIASVTETVQSAYGGYYAYPVYWNSSGPYCNYPDYYYYYGYDYCSYSYNYYPYDYGLYAYPSYSYSTSDSGVAPLSYVKATTPEYTALQSQFQTAQQQLNQSQAQNQQLQQQLQNAQNTISQKDASITSLNQQLNSSQNTNVTLEAAAAALAVLTILFGAFALRSRRTNQQQQPRPSQPQTTGTNQPKP
jgi:hypothetical protein